MKCLKDKKILWIVGAFILIVLIFLGVFYFWKKDEDSDALKFKSEYEALNGTIRASDKAKYNDISVSEDNPIKYINCKEALEIIDSEEAIIYVGAPWCPWCRNAVPVLFDVNKSYGNKTIYYLELDNEKSNFEVQNGELVNTVLGSEDYYRLLDKLGDKLRDYVITDNDIKYETNEKRIYMPYVVGIKNGNVINDHVGTVGLDEDQTKYSDLTSEQYNELVDIYNNMFKEVYGNTDGVCGLDSCE